MVDASPKSSPTIHKQCDRGDASYVFRKVPFTAYLLPSSPIEAEQTYPYICPHGSIMVPHDGANPTPQGHTVSFAVALDVTVPQDAYSQIFISISDPQTAIWERQQAGDGGFWKRISRSRHILFKVNPIESKEPFIRAYPQKTICGLCESLRPSGIPLLFALGAMRKLVDVAIRIECL